MAKVKVGVAGYGVIGQRLADGVMLQEDMKLIGVADIAPTISVRALAHRGMPYRMFNVDPTNKSMEEAGIPVSGSFDETDHGIQHCLNNLGDSQDFAVNVTVVRHNVGQLL